MAVAVAERNHHNVVVDAGVDTPITFMSSGDIPRSFVMTVRKDSMDIYDVDNDRTVCSGLFRSAPANVRFAAAFIPNLGWKEFSSYLSSQKEYHGGIPDIDNGEAVPFPGNAQNQSDLGLRPKAFIDIRTPDIIADDRDTSLPHRFPPVDRSGAILEILSHETLLDPETGRSNFMWDVRMSHAWDRSGSPLSKKGEEVDPDHDKAWAAASMIGSDVFVEACERALAPHMGDEDLDVRGKNGGFVVLCEYAGEDFSFASLDEAREIVSALNDHDLVILWSKIRSLDVDLNVENRTEAVREIYNDMRSDFEMRINDPEELSPDV